MLHGYGYIICFHLHAGILVKVILEKLTNVSQSAEQTKLTMYSAVSMNSFQRIMSSIAEVLRLPLSCHLLNGKTGFQNTFTQSFHSNGRLLMWSLHMRVFFLILLTLWGWEIMSGSKITNRFYGQIEIWTRSSPTPKQHRIGSGQSANLRGKCFKINFTIEM